MATGVRGARTMSAPENVEVELPSLTENATIQCKYFHLPRHATIVTQFDVRLAGQAISPCK